MQTQTEGTSLVRETLPQEIQLPVPEDKLNETSDE